MRLSSTNRGAIDKLKNHFSKVQIADKDADLDRDPYTSAAWSGNAFSSGTGTINWVTAFGLPKIPKGVFIRTLLRDSSAVDGAGSLGLKAKNTTTIDSLFNFSRPNNAWNPNHGLVPVADNGTTFYTIVSSAAGTCDIWILVVGWIK